MKFQKDFLRDMEWEKTAEIVTDVITGKGRWSIDHKRVFKFDGHFHETEYSVGATEGQEERAYEYDPDEIECPEVFPVTKTVTVYEQRGESDDPKSK